MGRMKQNAIERQEQAPVQPQRNFADILRSQWGKIEAVSANRQNSDRLFQMTVSAVNHNPKLLECDMVTLLSCVMRCSALGVEPSDVDGLGRAYILPFYNGKRKITEATFILGYKGMIDLARRSGEIKDIAARAVYEGDEFEVEFGLEEKLRYVPKAPQRTPDKLTHVYLLANYTNGGHHIEVMTRDEVEAVRKRSKSSKNGPWVTDYDAMAKKTVLRRAWPWLPISTEAQGAVNFDETTGGFEETLRAPVIDETPEVEEIPQEEPPAPEVEPEIVEDVASGQDEGSGLANRGSAVCQSCGCVVSDLAPDATLQDLNQFLCCDRPDYQWA